jgi:hypothetical protein
MIGSPEIGSRLVHLVWVSGSHNRHLLAYSAWESGNHNKKADWLIRFENPEVTIIIKRRPKEIPMAFE